MKFLKLRVILAVLLAATLPDEGNFQSSDSYDQCAWVGLSLFTFSPSCCNYFAPLTIDNISGKTRDTVERYINQTGATCGTIDYSKITHGMEINNRVLTISTCQSLCALGKSYNVFCEGLGEWSLRDSAFTAACNETIAFYGNATAYCNPTPGLPDGSTGKNTTTS